MFFILYYLKIKMENKIEKCTLKSHKEIDSVSYCEQCKIFMPNKCLNHHKELFEDHQLIILGKEDKETFIDICKEKGHEKKLEFFCKKHNQLCCVVCLAKCEVKGYGQHKECDTCPIENIKEEKKSKLKENIKCLEELSNNLEELIKEIQVVNEEINKNKEEIKMNVQKIFTKIRNALNDREDEILSDIDKKFGENFLNEEMIKESLKLPNKIKKNLEKGKSLDKDWTDNNKLSSLINSCINIEINIKNINIMNDNLKKCKLNKNPKFDFLLEEESANDFIKRIKELGKRPSIIKELDSLILKKNEDKKNFFELISKKIKCNNLKLLYRASKDGVGYNDLFSKINNKSNLIFLIFS